MNRYQPLLTAAARLSTHSVTVCSRPVGNVSCPDGFRKCVWFRIKRSIRLAFGDRRLAVWIVANVIDVARAIRVFEDNRGDSKGIQ